MNIYLIMEISISGWSTTVKAVFRNKENALNFINQNNSVNQYYLELKEIYTKD